MKTWENAEVKELNIEETAMGGTDFVEIDNNFYDEKGQSYSSYAKNEDKLS